MHRVPPRRVLGLPRVVREAAPLALERADLREAPLPLPARARELPEDGHFVREERILCRERREDAPRQGFGLDRLAPRGVRHRRAVA